MKETNINANPPSTLAARSAFPDPEGQLLANGWDTESVGGSRRAFQGTNSTGWHPTWEAVLRDAMGVPQNE